MKLFNNFDMRDAHIYGGMIIIAIGVLVLVGWPASLIALGVLMMYLGTYRMGRL
tara:strand:- start:1155 stop:1316 length:162 start_codon:yes stop_codon:yes gene_type:complete